MENQDQGKIPAPENHGGVHLCHKCGWPFPNPHPSARHRRAHKRVCGKIEGHKLIDSEGSNHSTLSDDEHVSDDDNKNPGPVIVETVKTEKGIDESKEKLKRSEDAFSDAVADDITESKLAGNTKDSSSISEIDKKEELTSSQSFKDCEISDLVQLPSSLTDEIILHNPDVVQRKKVDELEAGGEDTGSQQSSNAPMDIYIDRENMDSQSNVAVETNQPELKIEEIIERASDLIATEEVVRLKEGHPRADMASEVAAKSCSSDNMVEINGGGGGGEDRSRNVHTVSVLDDSNVDVHSEALLSDLKDHEHETPVREPEATEMKLIDRDNTKEEQEIDHIPKGSFTVDCTSNFSEVASVVEDSPENPDTKIEELPETDRKDIGCVSESNAIVVNSNARDGKMEPENSKPSLGPVYDESLIHSSVIMEDNITAEVAGAVLISELLPVEGNDVVEKPVVSGSPIDVLADSSSQADSVDATWGSVLSGISIRSDAPAVVEECKDVPQTFDETAAGAEKSEQKMQKAASQNSEKSDAFEAPSFSTLVEQGEGRGPNVAESENQSTKEPQAGWFPSFTPVPSDSDGRKKNEELIAKVTNWKAGKQHTPLKNLLGEAAMEAKQKLPKPESSPPPVQNDAKTAKNNGGTINSGQALDSPTTGGKEWDSPARLPEEIKKEKKKGKGRPYWAQYVCCTSANY